MNIKNKKDFLFGEFNLTKHGVLSIGFDRFVGVMKTVQKKLVFRHLERILSKLDNGLGIETSASYSNLGLILEGIGSENISKLRIYTSKEVNSAVPYTYCVDLYMTNGILHIYGNWSDYKDIRFDEVIIDMLAPIYKYGLESYTELDVERLEKPQLSSDYKEEIEYFMIKAGNHESITSRKERLYESFERCLNEKK